MCSSLQLSLLTVYLNNIYSGLQSAISLLRACKKERRADFIKYILFARAELSWSAAAAGRVGKLGGVSLSLSTRSVYACFIVSRLARILASLERQKRAPASSLFCSRLVIDPPTQPSEPPSPTVLLHSGNQHVDYDASCLWDDSIAAFSNRKWAVWVLKWEFYTHSEWLNYVSLHI